MYAQSTHAGDSQPAPRDTWVGARAGRSATQANSVRVANQHGGYRTHEHTLDSDEAPNNDRQASAAQSHRRLSVCV